MVWNNTDQTFTGSTMVDPSRPYSTFIEFPTARPVDNGRSINFPNGLILALRPYAFTVLQLETDTPYWIGQLNQILIGVQDNRDIRFLGGNVD